MFVYHASWILPIVAPPIRDGWVALEGGRIVALGPRERPVGSLSKHGRHGARGGELAGQPERVREVDVGSAVILPGLVNAHTHLELSWLRGLVGPAPSMTMWVRELVARRREAGADDPDAIAAAIQEASAGGTVLVGDISNTLASLDQLRTSRLGGVVFKEILGFRAPDPQALVRQAVEAINALPPNDAVRVSLAAHAPYSVSPALFQAIKAEAVRAGLAPWSVHLGESREEVELLQSGRGPWRDLLEDLGSWNPDWSVPACGPVEYVDRLGFLDPRLIVAHGAQFTSAELERLAERGVTLVTCPRSNMWTGAGRPPVEQFYASGVRVAVGTDSLASAPDLNIFGELAELRRLAPLLPASRLLASATLEGARALGFGDFGTIEPGQRDRLIAVDVPEGMEDVEEYLVAGIKPNQVRWLGAESALRAED